jgi:hypothetical protein
MQHKCWFVVAIACLCIVLQPILQIQIVEVPFAGAGAVDVKFTTPEKRVLEKEKPARLERQKRNSIVSQAIVSKTLNCNLK